MLLTLIFTILSVHKVCSHVYYETNSFQYSSTSLLFLKVCRSPYVNFNLSTLSMYYLAKKNHFIEFHSVATFSSI